MKIYSAAPSMNALRVRAVAYELGFDFELVEVDILKGETKTPEFRAINPNGKVPTLVDGDFVLWESRAIMGYLANLKPDQGLCPAAGKARAVVDQWCYWQAIHLGPAMQRVLFERVMKPKFGMGETDEDAIQQQLKDVAQFLPVLEGNLSDKDWVVGDLSIADFAVASTFPAHQNAGTSLADLPNISAWYDRMQSRLSWQKAVAPVLEIVGT